MSLLAGLILTEKKLFLIKKIQKLVKEIKKGNKV
jgi:hypothetical protein